jgi:hypothetical protein
METERALVMTREKHLDHMVKVVPFIVICYAVQCFVILKMGTNTMTTFGLSLLGGLIAFMIVGFIIYDMNHRVELGEESLKVSFLGRERIIFYQNILKIELSDPGENFSSIYLTTPEGKTTFYFVDDAANIQKWIEGQRDQNQTAA